MTTYYGNSAIKSMILTRSWGINPATAEVVCVGAAHPALDSEVYLTIGGTTWFGRVKGSQVHTGADGVTTLIRLVDNREVLMQSCVFGRFNMMDDDGSFYHMLPLEDWYYQRRSSVYTSGMPPFAVIAYILMDTPFGILVHSSAARDLLVRGSTVIPNLDWNHGKKRGTALMEVCDAVGLHFAISDTNPNAILIGQKGESPNPLTGNFIEHAHGNERIFVDNFIVIVGDPNIYELTDMPLYPDWPEDWNEYVWDDRKLLKALRDIDSDNPWTATVESFAEYYGYQYLDERTFSGYPRSEMLVGDYIEAVPFKVYALDLASTVTLNSETSTLQELMPILDRLVSDVDVQVKVSATGYKFDPHNPKQPLVMVENDVASGYEIDRNEGKVIFHDRKFTGDPASFLVGVGSQMKVDTDYLSADAPTITFAVQRELFTATWGQGTRIGSHHVRNLRKEFVCDSGGGIIDTVDRGATNADTFALLVAANLLSYQSEATSGYAKRMGQCGYGLAEKFDRITVTLDANEGITETVTYSNEEPQLGAPTERELARRVKTSAPKTDLARANDLWSAVSAAIAESKGATARGGKRGGAQKNRQTGDEVLDVGMMDSNGILSCKNYGGTFEVGDAVCSASVDATTGQHVIKNPASVIVNDPSFLGVVARDCDDTARDVLVKNSGLNTIAVNGAVAVGNSLGMVAGQKYCAAGNVGAGTAKEAKGAGTGFVRVQLGSGGGAADALLKVWYQSAQPTATAGKINIWYDTDDGHVYYYNFSSSAWRLLTGFM